jgi:DNA-binding cell septation regulator SpoVG
MKIGEMKKGSWNKVRAFFDIITEEGFTLKNFKLVEGINGLFVGFPSQKGNDEEYHDTVWADKELKVEVNKLAVAEYGEGVEDTGFDDIQGAFVEKKAVAGIQEDVPF